MQLDESMENNLFNELSDQEQEVVAGGLDYKAFFEGLVANGYLNLSDLPGGNWGGSGSGSWPGAGSGGSGSWPGAGSGGSGSWPGAGSGGSGSWPGAGSGGSGSWPGAGGGTWGA